MGGERLRAAALEMEKMLKAGDIENARSPLNVLEERFAELRLKIEKKNCA